MEIMALTTVVHDRCALVVAVSEKSCVTGRRSKSIVESSATSGGANTKLRLAMLRNENHESRGLGMRSKYI